MKLETSVVKTVECDDCTTVLKKERKPFRVRTFNLGQDAYVDQDMIYDDVFLLAGGDRPSRCATRR